MYKSLLKPRIEVQRGTLRGKFEQGRSCILDIDIHDGHEFYATYIGRTVLVKVVLWEGSDKNTYPPIMPS